MKVPLFTFASLENRLIAAMIIYLGQSRSRVIAQHTNPHGVAWLRGPLGHAD
jgi:hypothetical protein